MAVRKNLHVVNRACDGGSPLALEVNAIARTPGQSRHMLARMLFNIVSGGVYR